MVKAYWLQCEVCGEQIDVNKDTFLRMMEPDREEVDYHPNCYLKEKVFTLQPELTLANHPNLEEVQLKPGQIVSYEEDKPDK